MDTTLSCSSTDIATIPAVLLGISTPLRGLSIPTTLPGVLTVIVNVRTGILAADLAPGAVVRGGGSSLLLISGDSAQVNAKLASLSYTSMVAGSDTVSIQVLGADSTLPPATQTTIAIIPLAAIPDPASQTVYVDRGTLTLQSRTFDGPLLTLYEPTGSQSSTSCVLVNSTIGSASRISVRNDNAPGGVAPRIAIAGQVELDGAMEFSGNGTAISIAQGGILLNEGSIVIGAHSAQFTGGGLLRNNGAMLVSGDGSAGAPSRIETKLDGFGTVSLAANAALEIDASVGQAQTILFGPGANTLHLTRPADFAGQIAGFARGDTLVLDGAHVTGVAFSRNAETGADQLTLLDGTAAAGVLQFGATEADTVFQLGADAAGNVTISLATVASPAEAANPEVFRFFDAVHGTQLLTQDRAERDSIISGRADLLYEGVGLHALDPARADPNATTVYRFFDRSNGTHMLTSDTTERDTLLASRPDLVFEAGSTLLEHATAQAGDAAVYRFFDRSSGAHFYTADAGERATILSSRPDMIPEGIAFYAPTA